jgi:hypothetical protein
MESSTMDGAASWNWTLMTCWDRRDCLSCSDVTPHLREIKDWKTSTFLAIMRILGTDCTQEMYEIAHSKLALAQMQAYKIGEVLQ